ncbi:MAG: PEP-CTERM sorting domain-containing protein [Candidatus Omnitrophica bacterium]|nr:PEP-CTERM sorting domain-containing protein [Candidatus Omnitrophota bacterium]
MRNNLVNFKNALLVLALPMIYGCGGGGGGAISQLGSLFGGGSSSSSLAGGSSGGSGFGSIANIHHNPEPATMLLMGSGLALMACYRKKN